jgi:serine/threonine protein kinase
MEQKINRLLEYYDNKFSTHKVAIDEYGNYGQHYIGLNFEYYFDSSIFSIDYLNINDYFLSIAEYEYSDDNLLIDSLNNKSLDIKVKVIEAILSLIEKSNYLENESKEVITKSKNFLDKLGFKVILDGDFYKISFEIIKFRGSYCDVIEVNDHCYKKRLNDKHRSIEQWQKRLKIEYSNMQQLNNSDYILKVFNYDNEEHAYLMEKCECDLAGYLENNPGISNHQILSIIKDLLNGMNDVHKAGIIHRDLHLGNILRKDNHFILSDFGLSKDTMNYTSFKSSNTPKNSHMFMDPIGFTDFSKLDKLSDIYSIGKIIDYITQNMNINNKLSYLIEKSTNRDKKSRYRSIDEMLIDFHDIMDDDVKEKRMSLIQSNIKSGINSPDVEKHIFTLISNDMLSKYIVEQKLYNFWELINKFLETNQLRVFDEINNNYVDATGYMGFANYEIFSSICYNYIKSGKYGSCKRIALKILEGCAGYRGNSQRQLEEIKLQYPQYLSYEKEMVKI